MIGIGEKLSKSVFLFNRKMQENHLKDLIKHRFGAPTSRVSDLDYGEWDSRMCIFNEFVGDTDAADPRTTL